MAPLLRKSGRARTKKPSCMSYRRALWFRPRLELLENRILLSADNWIGGTGNWNDGSNWSLGYAPGSGDTATINTMSAATITIQSGDSIQIQNLSTGSNDTLSITGGGLTVTSGASTLSGALSMSGGAVTATGGGVSFTANGSTSIANASLNASDGATLSLPQLTTYTADNNTFQADGTGSLLDVSALSTVSQTGYWSIYANNGGTLKLSSLTSLDGSSDADYVTDDGSGTTLDLSALTTLTSANMTVRNGASLSLAALTDADGSNVYVQSGGSLSLPKLTSYAANYTTLQADGTGSVLDLSALTTTTLTGNLTIDATNGGTLNLSGLTSLGNSSSQGGTYLYDYGGSTLSDGNLATLDGVYADLDGSDAHVADSWTTFTKGTLVVTGDSYTLTKLTDVDGSSLYAQSGGSLTLSKLTSYAVDNNTFQADGTGSVLDLSALTTVTQTGYWNIEATNGGTLNVSGLTSLDGSNNAIYVTDDGSGSTLDLSALTTFTSANMTVRNGASLSLAALTDADGSNVYAQSGGSLSLPKLTSYAAYNSTFQSDGTGSVLDVSALTAITQTGNWTIDATNGGTLNLSGLTSLGNSSQGTTYLYDYGGSTLSDGNVTTLDGVYANLDGSDAHVADSWTAFTKGTLIVTGNSYTLTKLTDVDGSNLYVQTGGSLTLSKLTSYAVDNNTFQSDGTGSVLDLSALTTVTQTGYWSIEASNGGSLKLSSLTSLDGSNYAVYLTDDGSGSTFDLSSLTTFTNANMTVRNGASLSLASLTDADGSNVYVQSGGSLSLPKLTSYAANYTTLQADGTGSVLDLSALTTVTLSNSYWYIDATNGGTLNLSGLTSLGNSSQGTTYLYDYGGSTLSDGNVTTLDGVYANLDGSDAHVADSWTTFTKGTLVVTGNSYTLTKLTDVDGSNLYAQSGGSVTLSKLTSYADDNNTFQADGTGSVLDLSALTTVTQTGSWSIDATNGGTLNLSGLTSLGNSSQGSTYLDDYGNSTLLDGNVTTLDGVYTNLDGTDPNGVNSWTTFTNGSLYVNGSPSFTLPSLTEFSGSSLSLYTGVAFNMPVLTKGDLALSNGQSITIQGVLVSMPTDGTSGAVINAPQSQGLTITLQNNGTFSGGTTFNVGAGTTVVLQGGTYTGGVNFNVGAGATVDLTGGYTTTYDGTLTGSGSGTVLYSGGNLAAGPDGVALNFAGSMFQWTGGNLTLSSAQFTNLGTINAAGSGTLYLYFDGSPLNAGNIDIASGTLSLIDYNDANLSLSGNFDVAAGATLQFGNYYYQTITLGTGASISGAGTVEFPYSTTDFTAGVSYSNTGTMLLDGGTVDFSTGQAIQLGSLTESYGTLQGSDTVTVKGHTVWTGGIMAGTGTTVAQGGLQIGAIGDYNQETLDGRTFQNAGNATWLGTNGYFYQTNGSVFENLAGATLDIQSDLYWYSDNNGDTLVNQGTIKKSAGTGTGTGLGASVGAGAGIITGTGTTTISVDIVNSGTLEADAGTLDLAGNSLGTAAVSFDGPVTTNIYSGVTGTVSGGTVNATGGGAPYSSLAGTLTTNNIQFGTSTSWNWHPFGLTSFGSDSTGSLMVAVAGTYTFNLTSDDGGLLYIDGNLVINDGGVHGPEYDAGTVTLTAGLHTFEVQHFEDGANESGLDVNLPVASVTAGTWTANQGATLEFDSSNPTTLTSGANVGGSGTVEFSNGSVLFTAGSTYTGTGNVTVQGGTVDFSTGQPIQIASLTESYGTLQGSDTVTVTGQTLWTGGTMSGSGTTIAQGGLQLGAANGYYNEEILDGRTLQNAGNATWQGKYGYFYQSDGSVFENLAGATLDIQSDLYWYSDNSGDTLVNQGTIKKSAGTGTGTGTVIGAGVSAGTGIITGTGTTTISVDIVNSGTIEADAGTLDLTGNSLGTAAVSFDGPVTTNIYSGVTGTVLNGSVNATGGGAPYTSLAGTLTTNNIQFGTSTNYNWHPFGLSSFGADSTGSLIVAATGTYTFSMDSDDGSLLYIDGKLVINDGGVHGEEYDTGTATLTAGVHTFEVQFFEDGTGSSGLDLNVSIDAVSTGTWTANQGATLSFGGSGSTVLASGANVGGAGTVQFSDGTVVFSAGSTYTGTGNLMVQGGTVDFSTGQPVQLASLTLSSGTLQGSDTVTVKGLTVWTGGTMSGSGTTIAQGGLQLGAANDYNAEVLDGRTLQNAGNAAWLGAGGYFYQSDSSVFLNLVGGTFDIQSPLYWYSDSSGNSFINQGSMAVQVGTGTVTIQSDFDNRGSLDVQSGTLDLTGTVAQVSGSTLMGGTWQIEAGAALEMNANITTNAATVVLEGAASPPAAQAGVGGSGAGFDALAGLTDNTGSLSFQNEFRFTTVGDLTNSGTLLLSATSLLTVNGNFTQTSTGKLGVQIGSTSANGQFSQLAISGNAALDGTLSVSLTSGFGPVAGDTYPILQFATSSGDFASFQGVTYGRFSLFSTSSTATSYDLTALVSAPDLTVSNITMDPQGVAGQNFNVTYTVTNNGTVTATQPWQDSVYLSLGTTIDASAVLLGRISHTSDLAGGDSYTQTLTAPLPGLVSGFYHVIVLADSAGNVPDVNRANTLGVSSSTFSVTIPSLTLGGSVNGTLASGQALYYQLQLPAGETVQIKANFGAASAGQLYLRYGTVPTLANFDELAFTPGQTQEEIHLPSTRAGTYYILLQGIDGADGGTDFTLTAQTEAPLTISSISTPEGGNDGPVTMVVSGTGFTPNTQLSLVGSDGVQHAAQTILYRDNSTLWATFNLGGADAGQYDVVAQDNGQTATDSGAFTADGYSSPGFVEFYMSAPSLVQMGTLGTVTIDYQNISNTDAIAPLAEVTSNDALLKLVDQSTFTGSTVDFLAENPTGPAGILTPGAKGQITIYFQVVSTEGDNIDFQLNQLDDSQTIDWSSFVNSPPPAGTPAPAWNAMMINFQAAVGTSAGQFHQVLAQDATYLSQLGEYVYDLPQLMSYQLEQAGDTLPVSILASTTDLSLPAPGNPLSFSREFLQPISGRYQMGRFGMGWADNWEISATIDTQGNVTVNEEGSQRNFTRNADGSYTASPGDYGVLTFANGAYQLNEKDGSSLSLLSSGLLNYVQDPNGNRITAGYTNGQLTSLTDSNGEQLSLSYNAQGLVSQIADSTGRTVTYAYDSTGQHLLSMTGPQGTMTYTYTTGSAVQANALASIAFPGGTHQFFQYDSQGRLIGVSQDGNVDAVTFSYPAPGEVTTTDAMGDASSVLYDQFERPILSINQLGQASQFEYDSNSNLVLFVTPTGTAYSYRYDNKGNLLSQTDPLGNQVNFSYNTGTNTLASSSDPNGNLTTYKYDSNNNLLSITYANGTQNQFSYDPLGNLYETIDGRGQPLYYQYNVNGQVTRMTFADGTHEDYTYNAIGNLTSATDSTGTTTLQYDAAGNLLQVTYPSGMYLKFTYDAGGRRTQSVDQTGFTVNYQYDAAGRLVGLTDGQGNKIVTYTYDANGRLARKDMGNGTYTTYAYDKTGGLLHLINYAPDGTMNSRFDYTYDDLGRPTGESTLDGQWSYIYDADGQLIHAIFTSNNPSVIPNQDLQYVYDAAGNRTETIINGVTTQYAVNNMNQYTQVGSTAYTFDADGNLISATNPTGTTNYAYNQLNQLTSVSGPGLSETLSYDSLGKLSSSVLNGTQTNYLVDPTGLGQVVGEYNGAGGLIAHYTMGLGLVSQVDSSNNASYYDFDILGNTVGLTNGVGQYVNSYQYLPFGQTIANSASLVNPFTAGGMYGSLTVSAPLDLMRARVYDSGLGRFLSEDPIKLASGDTNYYRYVFNEPTLFVDTSGEGASDIAHGVLDTNGCAWAGGLIGTGVGKALGTEVGGVIGYVVGGLTPFGPVGAIIGGYVGQAVGGFVGGAIGGYVGGKIGQAICPHDGQIGPEPEIPPPPPPQPPPPVPPAPQLLTGPVDT